MCLPVLLPPVTGLVIEHICLAEHGVDLVVRLTCAQMPCPRCGQLSERVHSRAQRTLLDVPWGGYPVHLVVHLRRFFCTNPTCPARTFREQVPALAIPRARRTQRLHALLCAVGLAVAGEAGARLATQLGMVWSPDTLLRLVNQMLTPQCATVRAVGIDDWAYRTGTRYGTIVLDLERHLPIDLLPDRELSSVVTWLQAHPGIEIITRDRDSTYAQAGRIGAPQARQVADRWHLLSNLGEMLRRLVTRHAGSVQQVGRQVDLREPSTAPVRAPSRGRTRQFGPCRPPTPVHRVRRAWQLQTYQQVHLVGHEGMPKPKPFRTQCGEVLAGDDKEWDRDSRSAEDINWVCSTPGAS
jgi:transposase